MQIQTALRVFRYATAKHPAALLDGTMNALDAALDHITGQGQDNEPDYRRKHREKYGQEAA